MKRLCLVFLAALCGGLLAACGLSTVQGMSQKTPTNVIASPQLPAATTTQLPVASPTPLPSPTLQPTPPPSLWIPSYLPHQLVSGLRLPEGWLLASSPEGASIQLAVGGQNPPIHWEYAVVAPFPTITDSVRSADLRNAWLGQPAGPFRAKPLLLSPETLDLFSAWWGQPAAGAVTTLPADELVDYAWQNRPAWAIVPFEALEPRWKVLEVDGQSPLRKDFDPASYALGVPLALEGSVSVDPGQLNLPFTNRDASKLTTVILTGVTALVRGTALTMEARGITYPGEAVRSWLREADILHISNEIPFYSQCPKPVLYPAEIRFCSDPSYIALLDDIGTDIVELDGDHFGDYGPVAMQETLDLYRQRGWPYYGGGANAEEARQPILIEHNGNRLAFIGCNAKGIAYYATASQDQPGAVECDFDWLTSEIARLKNEGYLVIATFQHNEYYSYKAQPDLQRDFRRVAEAGAVIVSGSQAHQPHGMEFDQGSFIHYGLGNLFFDQYRYFPGPELDRAFIDRHVFYGGRYIGTELLTVEFVDLAKPRPTTAEERTDFLKILFTASGW